MKILEAEIVEEPKRRKRPVLQEIDELTRLWDLPTVPPISTALVPITPARVPARRPKLEPIRLPATRHRKPVLKSIRLPNLEILSASVERVTLSREGIRIAKTNGGTLTSVLPFDVPRFINAATLKALLGAPPSHRLFLRNGKRWIPVSDSHPVDLCDQSQAFRLGEIIRTQVRLQPTTIST